MWSSAGQPSQFLHIETQNHKHRGIIQSGSQLASIGHHSLDSVKVFAHLPTVMVPTKDKAYKAQGHDYSYVCYRLGAGKRADRWVGYVLRRVLSVLTNTSPQNIHETGMHHKITVLHYIFQK